MPAFHIPGVPGAEELYLDAFNATGWAPVLRGGDLVGYVHIEARTEGPRYRPYAAVARNGCTHVMPLGYQGRPDPGLADEPTEMRYAAVWVIALTL